MCSILVGWDWTCQGESPDNLLLALAGCLTRLFGPPKQSKISYITQDGMDYTRGFTIMGIHHSLVVDKLGLQEEPLLNHDKKNKKRSSEVAWLDGWEVAFTWGKTQFWDPARSRVHKPRDISSTPSKPFGHSTKKKGDQTKQTKDRETEDTP